jgi:3-isopropylmalate/(R)-2-methylmalate dehydratase small subunit
MALQKITEVKGKVVPIPGDDIDTDRIIPARYMKCITFDGLGEYLFYDTRFDKNGSKKDHPLNDAKYQGATIILGGSNFGCGSSREHAPQAIYRAGFRAVIAMGFAEIFFGNSTTLGIPCVTVSKEDLIKLSAQIEKTPSMEISIDLGSKKIQAGDQSYSFDMRESARNGLISGHWDAIGELLENAVDIEKITKSLPYFQTASA